MFFTNNTNSSNYKIYLNFVKTNSKHICDVLIGETKLSDDWRIVGNNYKKFFSKKNNVFVTSRIFQKGAKINLITLTFKSKLPKTQIRFDKECNYQNIRHIEYFKNTPKSIITYDKNFSSVLLKEDLNPPFIATGLKTNNNLIALVDTGINYNLPPFKNNIARKDDGKLLGYDFWDDNDLPFDNDPRANPFYPRRHGTTVFSVLMKEAPNINIAIYRFPALDMCKFKTLIEEIKKNSIRVVHMSMGSSNKNDWKCFLDIAKKYEEIIFVVSAGNNQQNIDIKPIYPASFKLKNIITVSSSTNSGQIGRTSNFGHDSVDFLIPAERMLVLDHRGVNAYTGGTSYAVPRMSALIARFLIKNKSSTLDEVMKFLKKRAVSQNNKLSKYGWIPDPTDNYLIE